MCFIFRNDRERGCAANVHFADEGADRPVSGFGGRSGNYGASGPPLVFSSAHLAVCETQSRSIRTDDSDGPPRHRGTDTAGFAIIRPGRYVRTKEMRGERDDDTESVQ